MQISALILGASGKVLPAGKGEETFSVASLHFQLTVPLRGRPVRPGPRRQEETCLVQDHAENVHIPIRSSSQKAKSVWSKSLRVPPAPHHWCCVCRHASSSPPKWPIAPGRSPWARHRAEHRYRYRLGNPLRQALYHPHFTAGEAEFQQGDKLSIQHPLHILTR